MSSLKRCLAKHGATGELVGEVAWTATPLGPMEAWPASMANAVALVLSAGFPSAAALGREPGISHVVYNDPFIPFLGHKHPAAMGRRAREVWPEIWDFLEWALRHVWRTGRPVTGKDLLLHIERGDRLEEIYASLSFSPICHENCVYGALICCLDTTSGVLAARREHTLRMIAEGVCDACSEDEVYRGMVSILSAAAKDVTFALVYALDSEGRRASLRASASLAPGSKACPREVHLGDGGDSAWVLHRVVATREISVVPCAGLQPSGFAALGPPSAAAVVPVVSATHDRVLCVLVMGLNPALAFDDAYEGFVRHAAREIGASLTAAKSREEARRRAEVLAELDRAKTMFLSNVTHEFRTPLTLILAPLEDLLTEARWALPPDVRAEIQGVRRHAYRLLRYVTTLLDFARADAGRASVWYEPTDLPALTSEIARAFEPAAARAGLRLLIDCPPADEPIVVARDMWEQIVLNLLSNAMKFTFAGEVEVSLRLVPGGARFTVRDTGTGIPAEALPRLFERFYRVPGARARSHQGIGIGLAVVKDLVEPHGGAVRVSSVEGAGTTFVIEVPRRSAHLPPERVRAPSSPRPFSAVTPFVEDALGWLDPAVPRADEVPPPRAVAGRILVAEDCAEMRDYLRRLLGGAYEVEAVESGAAALASARARAPDLVLADVVMPEVDGLALLRSLRDAPETRDVPVVMLSARAGEDMLVDALGEGADDYLVKPFSSRELLARVRTHLELARARREAGESKLKDVFLGLASHELRTPLTCFKLNVQLCHRTLRDVDPRLADRLAGLQRAVDRMTRLVDDMLNISAISSGKLSLFMGRCDLSELCRAIAAEQAQVSGRPLELAIPDGEAIVSGDEDRLRQVIGNLLSNAFKYSAEDRPVSLSLRTSDGEVVVSVRDAGPGIPEQELPRLFERFYRVPGIGVRTGSYVGLGLGLFLSKTIVEQHGGRIWVESTLGAGSTFSFALPQS